LTKVEVNQLYQCGNIVNGHASLQHCLWQTFSTISTFMDRFIFTFNSNIDDLFVFIVVMEIYYTIILSKLFDFFQLFSQCHAFTLPITDERNSVLHVGMANGK